MKTALFCNICLGLVSTAIGAVVPGSETQELAARQTDVHCSAGKNFVVTDISPSNETEIEARMIEQRAPYPGFCTTGNQICQLRFNSGGFVCQGYCHCLITSPCYDDDNYCFYQQANGGCYCT